MTTPSQQGTVNSGGLLGGTPTSGTSNAVGSTSLRDTRQNSQFATLNPPAMKTLVYAPDVTIQIAHNASTHDISKDIVRGQVVRKENSASSLFVTLANPGLRYTAPPPFARMDRITCYLTRVTKLQVFSGYLDTIPWEQAYPGTVDIRATCTLKRLLHTWWNPALPSSIGFFDQIGASLGTSGDGQVSDSGIGSILRNILQTVGNWAPNSIHIQNFPQEFITFLNNYMTQTNMAAANAQLGQQFSALILGSDTAPGPMGAVGYSASDPVGTAVSATNANAEFYVSQIVAAVDARGMGPQVDVAANSQTILQTGQSLETAQGGGLTDQQLAASVKAAGQQLSTYANNQVAQNANSDAAILALACVMVESGGGTLAITMDDNPLDPASSTFFHDGTSTNGSSVGLFQQQANGAWGTTAQRMNPYASAGMFLDALNAKTGWRNMQPGYAIWLVQQSDSAAQAKYQAAVTLATSTIQAYRSSQQGATNAANTAISQIPGAGAVTGLLGGGANPIGSTVGALATATTSPIGAAASLANTGGPNPNSEGAINAAYSMYLTPYNETSEGMDCSHLVQLSFGSIGYTLPRTTDEQRGAIPSIPPASAQRGDVLQTEYGGHTGIYLGSGLWIQTGGPTGVPGKIEAINVASSSGPNGVMWAGRVCANGGINPAAPFNPVSIVNGIAVSGGAPGTGIPVGAGSSTAGTGGGAGDEGIARNLFSYIFEPQNYASSLADYLTGEKAYIDDQPLMQIVVALASASLRSFQSAPNGDLIFYYPDQFGMDGKPAILNLEDIELKDCRINLSDDNLTTHVYIEGDYTMIGQADQSVGWLTTSGVATVQNTQLYQRLIQAAPGDIDSNLTAQQLMNRFGVRPYKDSYQIAGNAGLEFLLACQIFMGKWASQYETDIGLTFMPEIFPGMRINLVGHNLACYVSAVTHQFDWERGFTTQCTVNAAGNPTAASSIYSSVPGFLNPVSTTPGASNTKTTGTSVTGSTFASPIPGGLVDQGG